MKIIEWIRDIFGFCLVLAFAYLIFGGGTPNYSLVGGIFYWSGYHRVHKKNYGYQKDHTRLKVAGEVCCQGWWRP
jgi:hypothetical protein